MGLGIVAAVCLFSMLLAGICFGLAMRAPSKEDHSAEDVELLQAEQERLNNINLLLKSQNDNLELEIMQLESMLKKAEEKSFTTTMPIKDRLVVIKTDELDVSQFQELFKSFKSKGSLGVILIPSNTIIDSLTVKQAEKYIKKLVKKHASK